MSSKDFERFASYIESDERTQQGQKVSQVCEMCDEPLVVYSVDDIHWCKNCGVIHTKADGLWVLA